MTIWSMIGKYTSTQKKQIEEGNSNDDDIF